MLELLLGATLFATAETSETIGDGIEIDRDGFVVIVEQPIGDVINQTIGDGIEIDRD